LRPCSCECRSRSGQQGPSKRLRGAFERHSNRWCVGPSAWLSDLRERTGLLLNDQAEEEHAVPVSARDQFRDGRERTVTLSVILEALPQHADEDLAALIDPTKHGAVHR